MKRYLAHLSVLALVAAGYVFATLPSSNAQSYEPIRKAYNALAAKDSIQAPQVRVGDLFYPPSVSALPTCDADTEPAILFDQSDNLFKGCSNQSGSFQWNPLGGDVDQDGFVGVGPNAIDPDDTDANDPAGYYQLVSYSNPTISQSGQNWNEDASGDPLWGTTSVTQFRVRATAAAYCTQVRDKVMVSSFTISASTSSDTRLRATDNGNVRWGFSRRSQAADNRVFESVTSTANNITQVVCFDLTGDGA